MKRKLDAVFAVHNADTISAWEMQPDGSYVRRQPLEGAKSVGSHQTMIEIAKERHRDIIKDRKSRKRTQG